MSKQDTLDAYAGILAAYDMSRGRQWRPLVDTTNDPIISARRPKGWSSWQRSEDYYNEGLMVWMEVDAMLRRKSGGSKSIDDFARAFFGLKDGDYGEVTYTFADVADTLNRIVPFDWASFLTQRLTETGKPAPIQGLAMNGYTLAYADTPTPYWAKSEKLRGTDTSTSIGLVVNKDAVVTSTIWGSPAFDARIDVGSTIAGVNGEAFSGDRLKAAIVAAKGIKAPIRLLVKNGDRFRDVAIDYHDGPRYPRLQKTGTGDTGLDRLLAPR